MLRGSRLVDDPPMRVDDDTGVNNQAKSGSWADRHTSSGSAQLPPFSSAADPGLINTSVDPSTSTLVTLLPSSGTKVTVPKRLYTYSSGVSGWMASRDNGLCVNVGPKRRHFCLDGRHCLRRSCASRHRQTGSLDSTSRQTCTEEPRRPSSN